MLRDPAVLISVCLRKHLVCNNFNMRNIVLKSLIAILVLISAQQVSSRKFNRDLKAKLLKVSPVLEDGIVNIWGGRQNFIKSNFIRKTLNEEEVETKYFQQKYNHFYPNDKRFFDMVSEQFIEIF